MEKAEEIWPEASWQSATPAEMGMDEQKLIEAGDYALAKGGSGYIVRGGRLVMSWGSPTALYDLKSTTKSIGVTALGLAIKDGRLRLDDLVQSLYPGFGVPPDENIATGWLDEINIQQLATHTAGFDKPGGYIPLHYEPGSTWAYSDGGANWLAQTLTWVYVEDLKELMFRRVFTPIGIRSTDLTWRSNWYRADTLQGVKNREFGAGISANVDAMARIGYLYLRGGTWKGVEILPKSFVDLARNSVPDLAGLPEASPDQYCNASEHYGLLWWNNADGTLNTVPRDAYWSWGLYDSLIVVIPSLDLVAARTGSSWQSEFSPCYAALAPFLEPLAQSVIAEPVPIEPPPFTYLLYLPGLLSK